MARFSFLELISLRTPWVSGACECFFPPAARDKSDIEEALERVCQALGPFIKGEILPPPMWLQLLETQNVPEDKAEVKPGTMQEDW